MKKSVYSTNLVTADSWEIVNSFIQKKFAKIVCVKLKIVTRDIQVLVGSFFIMELVNLALIADIIMTGSTLNVSYKEE